MKGKNIILICLITIVTLAMIPSISAIDSSDWINVTVGGIDFKIPPEYEGGRLTNGSYSLNTVFDFGLLSLEGEKNLRNNYGYESTFEENYDVQEMEIDGHHAVAYFSNRSIVNHYVTYLFFETDGIIYALSYNGNDVNSTIKEIVSSSPKSKLSQQEFNDKLNEAQEKYIEIQEEYDRYYEYEQGYRAGYSQGAQDNRHNDILGYYFFYKLGQRRG